MKNADFILRSIMISKIKPWFRGFFSKPIDTNKEQAIDLVIPYCESLVIKLTWAGHTVKKDIDRAFTTGVKQVLLYPFMTKSDYKVWLISVLEKGNVQLNEGECDIYILNRKSNSKPISNIIPKLISRITAYEKQEDIRQSAEFLVLLGRLRRAISEVKVENLLEEEIKLYNRLLVGFDNEANRLPQWLVQFEAIKKRTWSEY